MPSLTPPVYTDRNGTPIREGDRVRLVEFDTEPLPADLQPEATIHWFDDGYVQVEHYDNEDGTPETDRWPLTGVVRVA